MGHDEHGPSYPEPRVCHCPACDKQKVSDPVAWHIGMLGWVLAAALLFYLIWPLKASGMDHGFDPSSPRTKWMERQIRPDMLPQSCCGAADSYPVDRYELVKKTGHDAEANFDAFRGDYKVWIEDGSPIVYPDGSKRDPWDIRIPLIVPAAKVNPETDDLDNPTDHGWLFFRPTNDHEPGTFYCFVRHPQGN